MDLQDFQRYEASFRGLNVVINLDVVTPAFLRNAADRLREEFKKAIAEEWSATSASDNGDSQVPAAPVDVQVEIVARGLEATARALEIERDVCAYLLTHVPENAEASLLISWDLTRKGEAVPCTEAELQKLNPRLVKALYTFCLEAGNPKKTTETQSEDS